MGARYFAGRRLPRCPAQGRSSRHAISSLGSRHGHFGEDFSAGLIGLALAAGHPGTPLGIGQLTRSAVADQMPFPHPGQNGGLERVPRRLAVNAVTAGTRREPSLRDAGPGPKTLPRPRREELIQGVPRPIAPLRVDRHPADLTYDMSMFRSWVGVPSMDRIPRR